MRTIWCVIFLSLTLPNFSQTEWVNPFIGTDGTGHTFPAAAYPFGMVQVGPDTRIDDSWEGCSGYHYSDKEIYGFSHTHLSGTGCSDYGDIMLMPYLGKVPTQWEKGFYKSSFSHSSEQAEPGYYSVMLDKGKIKCEMAAAEHAALHTYQVLGNQIGDTVRVVLDLSHRDKLLASDVKRKGTNAIMGFRTSKAWAKNQTVYYFIEADRPIFATSFIKQEEIISCIILSLVVKPGEKFSIKVGISGVDEKGAENNVQSEIKDFDISALRNSTKQAWNKELSTIHITDESVENKTNFYTALYHTMIHPNVFSDVDGRYRGRDGKIHTTADKYYTVFSLWDTFRALHPLHSIINRKRTQDFVSTFLLQYQQGGRLPMWELWCNETDCMIGYHAVPVMADAMAKDIPMDHQLALEAAISNATYNERSVPLYAQKGYLEIGDEAESVAKTLEYAYDDWCVALLANAVDDDAATGKFLERSTSWMNMLDPETGLMRPRSNGGRLTPFDPREVNNHYTEANAWQYSFFVPHDVYGLINAVGGNERFENLLDKLFSEPTQTTGREQADITGLVGQYAHGNEPSHHMAYLYNYVGKPEKTAKIVHQILTELYHATPDGLPGNEDCGQMSAWYVFSAMGFYPVTPGSNHYAIGFPLFKESTMKLENGQSFTVKATGNIRGNYHIVKAELNGKPLNRLWITYEEIMAGGTLYLEFGANESHNWNNSERFPSMLRPKVFSAAPDILAPDMPFKNQIEISIKPFDASTIVLYTIDGSDPKTYGKEYTGPITSKDKIQVRAVSKASNGYYSAESKAVFLPFPHPERKVKIFTPYTRQYNAGGDEGLIDGIRGTENWRKGDWQGYQGTDFSAEIDLSITSNVHRTEMGFLQDARSWILAPTSVSVEYLDENKVLINRFEKKLEIRDKEEKTFLLSVVFNEQLSGVRYVRVKAINYGNLPGWHPGAGSSSFIFTDEIIVE